MSRSEAENFIVIRILQKTEVRNAVVGFEYFLCSVFQFMSGTKKQSNKADVFLFVVFYFLEEVIKRKKRADFFVNFSFFVF